MFVDIWNVVKCHIPSCKSHGLVNRLVFSTQYISVSRRQAAAYTHFTSFHSEVIRSDCIIIHSFQSCLQAGLCCDLLGSDG
jgi:hypothetical protein